MSASSAPGISIEELQLAARNHGMPLEALQYPVTPIGLHYVLVHYDIPVVDPATWRVRLTGCVDRPLELTLDDLRSMPTVTRTVTMECAGNGRALLDPRPTSQPWLHEAVGTGEWTGVRLEDVLDEAGVADAAVEVVLTGADRGIEGGVEQAYQRSLGVEEARSSGAILALLLNGVPLPPQHGFPVRAVVPGWYGMTNVKWLAEIAVVDAPFTGYQQATSYRLRQTEDEAGVPVTRMAPRSLMVPPGIPDFFTRVRTVTAGDCELVGRAWSGFGDIAAVEVSTDGGLTWGPAEVGQAAGPAEVGQAADAAMWVGWRFGWRAEPGEHELRCRATDTAGNTQPVQADWNHGGYQNNAVHRVHVRVVG
jgi:DMSO/TMAO reductase YedYZ molybdopterin-dependent catalytic subunit